MTDLPKCSHDAFMRQTDWFCRHLMRRDHDCYALARRLSGNFDGARHICDLALRKILEDGNWRRIVNPHAYMMRLIFDIAVARMETTLLPASQYIADREVGPLPVHDENCRDASTTMRALNQMLPAHRKILWAWRVDSLPLEGIARKFRIKPAEVSGHVARSLTEFHTRRHMLFCNPAHVCRRTDDFFGGEAVRRLVHAKQHRRLWRLPLDDLRALLMGATIGGIAVLRGIVAVEIWPFFAEVISVQEGAR